MEDPELAGPVARGVNRWLAALMAPYRDRMTVGAIVPMCTPDTAEAVLRDAVGLGFRSVVISGYARRWLGGPTPEGGPRPYRLDHFGVDSAYDYDPFWAACVELGVAPVSHSAHQHHRVSRSPSSYVFNHIGGLATSHESLAKALVLGGVTYRFPQLRVGFLEGGVAWACSLFADLIGHWQKRNAKSIVELDPDRLDVDAILGYVAEYGDASTVERIERIGEFLRRPAARPARLDEFDRAAIERVGDFFDRFARPFFFGCEADDPLVAWAFNERVNPLGVRLQAIFGSDISHWDVPDMTEPVAEAWELVERGVLSEDDFRALMFVNPVRLHGPGFFAGTAVAAAVAGLDLSGARP